MYLDPWSNKRNFNFKCSVPPLRCLPLTHSEGNGTFANEGSGGMTRIAWIDKWQLDFGSVEEPKAALRDAVAAMDLEHSAAEAPMV